MAETGELVGDLIRLRPVVEADRAPLLMIRSTDEVRRRWRGEDLDAEFTESLADDETVEFAIEDPAGRIVGLIQFGEEDDPDYRHVSIDIYIDPEMHRRGYASER